MLYLHDFFLDNDAIGWKYIAQLFEIDSNLDPDKFVDEQIVARRTRICTRHVSTALEMCESDNERPVSCSCWNRH